MLYVCQHEYELHAYTLAALAQVVFLNQQGMLEAGIDQGGLLKEFIEEVSVASGHLFQVLSAAAGQSACLPSTKCEVNRPHATLIPCTWHTAPYSFGL